MSYIKKPISKGNFIFTKISQKNVCIKRLELENIFIDRNKLDQYVFNYNMKNCSIDKIILDLKKTLPENSIIIPPIKNGKLQVSGYRVKNINQTKINNKKKYLGKPQIGDICDCDLIIDNLYSFIDNPNIYRFKIKVLSMEIIY